MLTSIDLKESSVLSRIMFQLFIVMVRLGESGLRFLNMYSVSPVYSFERCMN